MRSERAVIKKHAEIEKKFLAEFNRIGRNPKRLEGWHEALHWVLSW